MYEYTRVIYEYYQPLTYEYGTSTSTKEEGRTRRKGGLTFSAEILLTLSVFMVTLLAPQLAARLEVVLQLGVQTPTRDDRRIRHGLLIVPCTRPCLLPPAFSAACSCGRSRPAPPALVRWSLRVTICGRDIAGGRCLAASGMAPTRRSYYMPDTTFLRGTFGLRTTDV